MKRTLDVNFPALVSALSAAARTTEYGPIGDGHSESELLNYLHEHCPIGDVMEQAKLCGVQIVEAALRNGVAPTPALLTHQVMLSLYTTGIVHGWHAAQQQRDAEMRAMLGVED